MRAEQQPPHLNGHFLRKALDALLQCEAVGIVVDVLHQHGWHEKGCTASGRGMQHSQYGKELHTGCFERPYSHTEAPFSLLNTLVSLSSRSRSSRR